jgi:3-hydroxyisobutyrate dehydrogenase-like beta-hydroxyacid dehydrogenase
MRIGFIGLGNMGSAMARNLLRAGNKVTVFNRTRARAEDLARQEAAAIAPSPGAAAAEAEVVITMLADDAAVEGVVFGDEGVLTQMPENSVHLAMSTISPALSRRLADAHGKAGRGYLAAPVFGRPEAAESGKLWIVAAGRASDLDFCRPILSCLGQGVTHVGEDAAAANVIKVAGNFLLASAIEGMGEALALVRKHGISPERFLEIVVGKVFQSPVYEKYGARILQEAFEPAGFKLKHGLKDMRLVLGAAEEVAAPMPLASLLHDHYLSGLARGWADIDWAAIARVVAEDAGIKAKKR